VDALSGILHVSCSSPYNAPRSISCPHGVAWLRLSRVRVLIIRNTEWDTRQSGKPVCCKSSERNVPHMGNQSEIKMALVCKPIGLALQAATTIIKF
jgi:hypothetical protein